MTRPSNSQKLFSPYPKATLEVRRIPSLRKRPRPAPTTRQPRWMGRGPGVFYANLRDMSETANWTMPTLAYHEGVPGHHWQISLAQEFKGLPQFRRSSPLHRLPRRLGALRRVAGEGGRLVCARSLWRSRPAAGRALPRRSAGGRYRHTRETLAPRNRRSPTCWKRPAWAKKK